MKIKLENKTQVEDAAILAFIERVYEAHSLRSTITVKVTNTTRYLCPGAEMYSVGSFPPRGFRSRSDVYIWLRLPATKLIYSQGEFWAAYRGQEATNWFEYVVRHEMTHVWQYENLPHFHERWFKGEGRYRRANWKQRPIEIDCNRRMKEVEAQDGTKDQENVVFYKEYLVNELLGG